jgi:hypothetical protein
MAIQQPPTLIKVTIANGAALSEEFYMGDHIVGLVHVPDSWTAANIGFKISPTSGGTFVVAKDDTGVPIQISTVNTTTGAAYAIPTKLAGASYVKIWSKNTTAATETDANQTNDKAINVILK